MDHFTYNTKYENSGTNKEILAIFYVSVHSCLACFHCKLFRFIIMQYLILLHVFSSFVFHTFRCFQIIVTTKIRNYISYYVGHGIFQITKEILDVTQFQTGNLTCMGRLFSVCPKMRRSLVHNYCFTLCNISDR